MTLDLLSPSPILQTCSIPCDQYLGNFWEKLFLGHIHEGKNKMLLPSLYQYINTVYFMGQQPWSRTRKTTIFLTNRRRENSVNRTHMHFGSLLCWWFAWIIGDRVSSLISTDNKSSTEQMYTTCMLAITKSSLFFKRKKLANISWNVLLQRFKKFKFDIISVLWD